LLLLLLPACLLKLQAQQLKLLRLQTLLLQPRPPLLQLQMDQAPLLLAQPLQANDCCR
jgi:hypothetical protein